MLSDDLAANGAPGSGMDISKTLPLIRGAQKFVLSPEFAAVADALSEDYTGLVRVFGRCRLPYTSTWIEVAHAERPNFLTAEMHAPAFQVRPKRVGWLLQATRPDLSAWKAHLFWSTDLGCSCAALAMDYDMITPLCSTVSTDGLEAQPKSSILNITMDHPGWRSASESVKLAMLNHTAPSYPDYGVPLPIGVPRDQISRFYEITAELARSDWAGEAGYLLAVIGLLNARNAAETESVDLKKLNKARVKRGKLPLFSHKLLKIHHRQIRRAGDGSGDHIVMRGHFVRGHFKTRKSGVYFWHPHARGDFSRGMVIKDYELTR